MAGPLALRRLASTTLAFALGLGAACYSGLGSIGAFCELSADCGEGQTCENSICGSCRDGVLDPGEFCMSSADEIQLGAAVRLMSTADFDEDGDLDMLAATNTNCVTTMGPCWFLHILVNRGDGTMDSARTDPFPGAIESATVRSLDAAFTLTESNFITVVLNIFAEDAVTLALEVPGEARSVRADDLNGDGHVDIVVAADSGMPGESVYTFDGDGAGNFADYRTVDAGAAAWIGPLADLDDDGDLDMVVANIALNQVTVLANDGTGAFSVVQELPAGMLPSFVAMGQLDDDNLADIVVVNTGDSSLSIYRGNADGVFDQAETLATGPTPVFVEMGDINNDDETDLIVANADDDKLSVFLGRDGGFPDQVEFDVSSTPTWVIREDFNGDDVADLAVASGSSLAFSFFEP